MNELDRYCASRDVVLALCERMGVNESTVWRWRNGKAHPGLAMRKVLAKATKGAVPVESWTKKGRKR